MRRWFLRTVGPAWRTLASTLGAMLAGPSRRLAAVFAGLFFAAIGSWLFAHSLIADKSNWTIACSVAGTFLLSMSASVVAAALMETYLENRNLVEQHIRDTGIQFIGDRELFHALRKRGNLLGWDAWIRETPSGGQLLVVGKQNRYWMESADSLADVLKREGNIELVFMGSREEVEKSKTDFKQRWRERLGQDLPPKVALLSCIEKDLPDSGYYWNGRELLMKVYVPGQPKEKCPIIAFDVQGSSYEFNIEDFHPRQVPYQQAQALIQAANGLNQLIIKARASG